MLMAYLPAERIAFQADLFDTHEPPRSAQLPSMRTLANQVARMKLDVDDAGAGARQASAVEHVPSGVEVSVHREPIGRSTSTPAAAEGQPAAIMAGVDQRGRPVNRLRQGFGESRRSFSGGGLLLRVSHAPRQLAWLRSGSNRPGGALRSSCRSIETADLDGPRQPRWRPADHPALPWPLGPARDFAESQLAFILRLKQGRVSAAARVSINVITPAVLAMRRCRVPRPGLSGLEVGRLAG